MLPFSTRVGLYQIYQCVVVGGTEQVAKKQESYWLGYADRFPQHYRWVGNVVDNAVRHYQWEGRIVVGELLGINVSQLNPVGQAG